jgi:hypothetical protein
VAPTFTFFPGAKRTANLAAITSVHHNYALTDGKVGARVHLTGGDVFTLAPDADLAILRDALRAFSLSLNAALSMEAAG